MTVSVYEVEVVSPAAGQRLVQHIFAESQQEAEAKVAAIQKLEIIGSTVRRVAKPAEEAVFLAAKEANAAEAAIAVAQRAEEIAALEAFKAAGGKTP